MGFSFRCRLTRAVRASHALAQKTLAAPEGPPLGSRRKLCPLQVSQGASAAQSGWKATVVRALAGSVPPFDVVQPPAAPSRAVRPPAAFGRRAGAVQLPAAPSPAPEAASPGRGAPPRFRY